MSVPHPQKEYVNRINKSDIEWKDSEQQKKYCIILGTRVLASFDTEAAARKYQQEKLEHVLTAIYIPDINESSLNPNFRASAPVSSECKSSSSTSLESFVRQLVAILPQREGFDRTIYMMDKGKCELFDPDVLD